MVPGRIGGRFLGCGGLRWVLVVRMDGGKGKEAQVRQGVA